MAEHPTTQYVDADLTRGELRVLSELSEAAGAALFAQAQAVVAAKLPAVVVDPNRNMWLLRRFRGKTALGYLKILALEVRILLCPEDLYEL